MQEAGWNQFARNPSSGAYGIPQALPPIKMGAAANPPQSNPTAQIRWMIGYIKGRYGDPIGAEAHERTHGWYAQGGVVGGDGKKKPVDPQRAKWLAQLARDVKVLDEDQKHAAKRRKVLRHAVEIGELWFLTHPNVRKHGIGFDEHERALRGDERRLSHFNRRESDKEKELARKIAILRDLTGFPKGAKYGGPGSPAPDPGAGDGGGDGGGGDTGGGTTTAPTGPPPIPPPPMPEWMVSAGLGGSTPTGGFTFPAQMAPRSFGGGVMGLPDPVTYQSPTAGAGPGATAAAWTSVLSLPRSRRCTRTWSARSGWSPRVRRAGLTGRRTRWPPGSPGGSREHGPVLVKRARHAVRRGCAGGPGLAAGRER